MPGSEVYASESALKHLTILGNSAEIGGGVHVESSSHAPVNVHNSILADNVGGDCAGGLSHSQGNFIKDGSCDAEISGDPMVGDLVQPEDGSLHTIRSCPAARQLTLPSAIIARTPTKSVRRGRKVSAATLGR